MQNVQLMRAAVDHIVALGKSKGLVLALNLVEQRASCVRLGAEQRAEANRPSNRDMRTL